MFFVTYFKTNPWFNACFVMLFCFAFYGITYSVLSCKLGVSYSTVTVVILSVKNGKSLWSSCIFSVYLTSISKKYRLLFFSL